MQDSGLFAPPADRRNALDRAHIGDIEGALGTVAASDTGPRRTWRRRVVTLAAVLGPGVVVMAADNDAGTFAAFGQAGQDHGLSLLWVLVLLVPALYVTQEMVARLGAVTGSGHIRLVRERFGRAWSGVSLAELLVLNLATLVTEFIGVGLALSYFGVSHDIAVPLAALTLAALSSAGSFRRWEQAMWLLIALDVILVPLAFMVGSGAGSHVLGRAAAGVPSGPGDGTGGWLLLIVALIGSTLAPWQLFFQQSTVVDKRITPRWLNYERADTAIGAVVFALSAGAVLLLAAAAASHSGLGHHFRDAGALLSLARAELGSHVGAVLALALLNGSLLCASAVSLSSSYAVAEIAGHKHSLHRRFSDALGFHAGRTAMLVLAAGIALVPGLPAGVVTTLVQALTAVLLPSTLVLLLLLCNDRDVLGPLRNGRTQNLAAGAAVALIMWISSVLTLRLALPHVALIWSATAAAAVITAGGSLLTVAWARELSARRPVTDADAGRGAGRGADAAAGAADPVTGYDTAQLTPWELSTWSTPALERLAPAAASPARRLTLGLVRGYLLAAALLLIAAQVV